MSEKVGLKSHEKVDFHKEIAIIGGGPAGALAGYLLAKKGFTNVTIYDTGQFKIEQKSLSFIYQEILIYLFKMKEGEQ